MGVVSNYFMDAPTLSQATAIYTDATMTTPAADGFYSDESIVRQQVSGVLLAPRTCPSCPP